MIYVTQGHESSISLEIFLKSFLMLDCQEKEKITLVVNEQTLEDAYKILNLSSCKNNISLQTFLFSKSKHPQSTVALEIALDKMDFNKDILLTMPTSKDQLILNSKNKAGYTEYLRDYFKNPNIAMTFKNADSFVLLITDHVPLESVPKISKEIIVAKTEQAINGAKKYFEALKTVYFSGINPHAGENGIIGDEDKIIIDAICELKDKNPDIKFFGPYSGDVLHYYTEGKKDTLGVYMFHDQGLSYFKSKFQLIGLNISLGLPFLRMSVDHGTAFDQYGKNQAQYLGTYYLLQEALKVQQKIKRQGFYE